MTGDFEHEGGLRELPQVLNTQDCGVVFRARMGSFNKALAKKCKSEDKIKVLRLKGLHDNVDKRLEDAIHLSVEGRNHPNKRLASHDDQGAMM